MPGYSRTVFLATRRFIPILAALFLASRASAGVLAITHANVVSMVDDRIDGDQTVIIRDDTIDAVGPSATTSIPAEARVIDGRGRWLLPGLIDSHVHVH